MHVRRSRSRSAWVIIVMCGYSSTLGCNRSPRFSFYYMVLNNYGTINVHNFYSEQPEQQLLKNAGIPKDLSSEEAIKLWTICQEKGWIDADLQPKGITQEQAAIIADAMGAKLSLLYRWSDFEELWKIKNLRGKFDRGYNHNESLQSFAYDVEIAISRA